MAKFLDRTNMRYGRLLVIKHAGKDHRNKHLWLCKCDCGKEKVVVSDNLSSGKSKSCGCLKREFLARKGNQWGLYENREIALLKVQYSHLTRRNKKLGFENTTIKYDYVEFLEEKIAQLEQQLENTKNDSIKSINDGDWVAISRQYAKEHGQTEFGTQFKILSKVVRANELYTEGNSLSEWGYVKQ